MYVHRGTHVALAAGGERAETPRPRPRARDARVRGICANGEAPRKH